ncbi:MAG: histidine phosphatase family protein [Chloracidobacterium sp.]|nr:histidine phosphatase family protein [Chloracidobacterium sp.]
MKVLYILRHAKSSWDDALLADFDRPLNRRGQEAAPFMGSFMAENSYRPELIVSSPAKRAAQTAEHVRQALDPRIPLEFDEQIYEASPGRLLSLITELPDRYSSALIVGHNPGIEGLIYALTGEGVRMPTAALAGIEFDVDRWQDAGGAAGRLAFVFRPKELAGDKG